MIDIIPVHSQWMFIYRAMKTVVNWSALLDLLDWLSLYRFRSFSWGFLYLIEISNEIGIFSINWRISFGFNWMIILHPTLHKSFHFSLPTLNICFSPYFAPSSLQLFFFSFYLLLFSCLFFTAYHLPSAFQLERQHILAGNNQFAARYLSQKKNEQLSNRSFKLVPWNEHSFPSSTFENAKQKNTTNWNVKCM